MKADFKTIALVGKFNSPASTGSLLRLADYLRRRGHAVMLTAHAADSCEARDYPVSTLKEIGAQVDVAIVMGGDGTLLNIARSLVDSQVPLIGDGKGQQHLGDGEWGMGDGNSKTRGFPIPHPSLPITGLTASPPSGASG